MQLNCGRDTIYRRLRSRGRAIARSTTPHDARVSGVFCCLKPKYAVRLFGNADLALRESLERDFASGLHNLMRDSRYREKIFS